MFALVVQSTLLDAIVLMLSSWSDMTVSSPVRQNKASKGLEALIVNGSKVLRHKDHLSGRVKYSSRSIVSPPETENVWGDSYKTSP